MTIWTVSKACQRAKYANVSLDQVLTMGQTNMEPNKSYLVTFYTTKVEISLSIFPRFESCNFGTILPSTLVQ